MISWLRTSLSFSVLILIAGGFLAEPVIKAAQAKDMFIQMEASILTEAPINIGHSCKDCAENNNTEHCSNLCTAATLAINENKSFEIYTILNEPPLVTLISMFEYTPSVELTPPRT